MADEYQTVMLRVRYERLRRGITQTAMARAAEVNQSDLGKIERGQYRPPAGSTVLARVARVLDVPVSELLQPVEIVAQDVPPAPAEVPIPVPPIPVIDDGPTPHQIAARARQQRDREECEAVNKADEEPVAR